MSLNCFHPQFLNYLMFWVWSRCFEFVQLRKVHGDHICTNPLEPELIHTVPICNYRKECGHFHMLPGLSAYCGHFHKHPFIFICIWKLLGRTCRRLFWTFAECFMSKPALTASLQLCLGLSASLHFQMGFNESVYLILAYANVCIPGLGECINSNLAEVEGCMSRVEQTSQSSQLNSNSIHKVRGEGA